MITDFLLRRIGWMEARCTRRRTSRLVLALCCAPICAAGCGVTEVDAPPPALEGVWQQATATSEVTIELRADGSAAMVEADLAGSSCESASGRWVADGASVRIEVRTRQGQPVNEQVTLPLAESGSGFTRATRMVGCVSYGWGQWIGTLSADVDGSTISYDTLEVTIDIVGGAARVVGLGRTCPTCQADTPQLVVEINSVSGALLPAIYSVQNVPGAERTLYGFFHPDPGSPTFIGFDTTRLSPPGSLSLSEIGLDRIRGTFEFRVNPRVEGQSAPDGSDTALLTSGVVDLTYR